MNDSTSSELQRAIEARSHGLLTQVLSLQAFWVLAAALLAAVILSFATDAFATPQNLFNVTRNFAFVAIVAIGMTAVIITGGIDLSVGSTLCLSAMVTGVVLNAGYRGWVGIEYEGGRLSEPEGIKATKRLLESLRGSTYQPSA